MEQEKEKILKHSQIKFFHEGFYKITMDELARELQISKKTIYKYFPSKEKLVEEICDFMMCSTNDDIASIIDAKEDVIWKFVSLLKMYSHRIISFSDKWRHDMQIHSPHVWARINDYRSKKIYAILNKLLKQGKHENLIENIPIEIIIASFNSTIQAVVNPDFISTNKFSMNQAFVYTFELLLNGILTKQGKEIYQKKKVEFEIEIPKNNLI